MDELAIRSPFEGLDLPMAIGDARLAELPRAPIRVIAPYRGREAAVSEALRAALGSGLPQIGRTVPLDGGRLIWAGTGQWMLTGPAAAAAVSALAGLAAVTDQSDGWAAMWLEGSDARAVLARLLPLDLEPAAFPEGAPWVVFSNSPMKSRNTQSAKSQALPPYISPCSSTASSKNIDLRSSGSRLSTPRQ